MSECAIPKSGPDEYISQLKAWHCIPVAISRGRFASVRNVRSPNWSKPYVRCLILFFFFLAAAGLQNLRNTHSASTATKIEREAPEKKRCHEKKPKSSTLLQVLTQSPSSSTCKNLSANLVSGSGTVKGRERDTKNAAIPTAAAAINGGKAALREWLAPPSVQRL